MDAILLKLPDDSEIKGDSTIEGYEDAIELLSYSHGVSAMLTMDQSQQNRTSGRPSVQEFNITKYVDGTSPKLNQACCSGTDLGTVEVTVGRNDEGQILPLIQYRLYQTVVSSVSVGGGGGGKPTESVSLNFTKIDWIYTLQQEDMQSATGPSGSWDLTKNTVGDSA